MFVCQELLEKYGYLDCVPPGSEANTRLHRLLLYRRRHLASPAHHFHDGGVSESDEHKLGEHLPLSHNTDGDERLLKAPSEGKPQTGSSKRVHSSSSGNADKDLVQDFDSTRHTVTVWDPFSGYLHHLPICSPGDIAKAVRKFQVG